MSEVRNALIEGTFLGIEDHGLLAMTVFMDYGDSGQGYQRILGEHAVRLLRDLLTVLHAESWEHLKGMSCRVRIEGGLIRQVGHFINDEWTED